MARKKEQVDFSERLVGAPAALGTPFGKYTTAVGLLTMLHAVVARLHNSLIRNN